jgi:hypothetical protein
MTEYVYIGPVLQRRQTVYSKCINGLLTHLVFEVPNSLEKSNRFDIIEGSNFLQCAFLHLMKNESFTPHIHPVRHQEAMKVNTQECWVILRGSVTAYLFDVDGKPLQSIRLYSGSLLFTLAGGHTYKSEENGTQVLEFKSGPYFGPDVDKSPLNNIPLELE